MFCTNCGNQLKDGARFCTACGQKLENAPQAPAPAPIEPEMPVHTPIVQNSLDPMAPPVPHEPIVQNSLDPMAPPVEQEPPLVYADTDPDLTAQKPPKKKKKGLIIGIIAGVVAVAAVAVTLSAISLNKKSKLYAQARDLMAQKNYAEAIVLFEELGGYKESEVMLNELLDNQEAYAEAMELLNEHKYEEAIEAFEDLDDYADSANMAACEVNYRKAMFLMENARTENMEALSLIIPEGSAVDMSRAPIMMYEAASEIFVSLGDYSDARQMAMQCYYGMGQVYLEWGEWDAALTFMSIMDETTAASFYEEYLTYCADGPAMEALKDVLVKQQTMDDATEILNMEMEALEPYVDAHFAEPGVKELLMEYLDAVYIQYAVKDEMNTIDGYLVYLEAGTQCADVVDALYNDYGFLADDAEVAAQEVGWGDLYRAWYDLYKGVDAALDGEETFTMKGMYLLQFKNPTKYDGTMLYSFTLYNGDTVAFQSEELRADFTAGANVTLNTGALQGEVTFDSWVLTYHGWENIKLDGKLLPHQD